MSLSDRAFRARAAAVALLLVLMAAIWLGPVMSYLDLLNAGAAQIERQGAVLQHYRALIQAGQPARPPAAPVEPMLLPELPDAQAVALLQETVKAAAAAAQIQVQGLQVLRSEALPGAVRVGVRVRATGDTAGLSRLLYAIEAARPSLLADNLQVQAPPMLPASPPAATPVRLEFQLDVSGVKPGGSS